MKKISTITWLKLLTSIVFVIGSFEITELAFSFKNVLCIILGLIALNYSLDMFSDAYSQFSMEYFIFNKERCEKLSDMELEMVEDAKVLIKKVDDSLILSDFNVYKTKYFTNGFYYEHEVFIPFKFTLLIGKELAFMVLVHEILHSQNLKNDRRIFQNYFLEGLNQLLTIWLIENYSEKYKIPKTYESICGLIIRTIYKKEIKTVRNVLESSNIDLKDVYLNYIDLNPAFFRRFVPSEYFLD